MSTYLFLAATKVTDPLVVAVAGAAIAGLVAAVTKAVDMTVARQTRRRELYSRAFEAALAWEESLYRVRRRPTDKSGDRALVERFHDLQERINYHQGWLQMEDPALGAAYRDLVRAVKAATREEIQNAWQNTHGREPTEPLPEGEKHPDTRAAQDAFIAIVRSRLLWGSVRPDEAPWDGRGHPVTPSCPQPAKDGPTPLAAGLDIPVDK